jgi:hypothetical protein
LCHECTEGGASLVAGAPVAWMQHPKSKNKSAQLKS